MCFNQPSAIQTAAPVAAAAPAPAPLADQTSPTATRDAQDTSAYGAGGQPNLRRDKSATSSGVGVGGAGIGTSGGGSGITM